MTSLSLTWKAGGGERFLSLLNFPSLSLLCLRTLLGCFLTTPIAATEKSEKPRLVLAAPEDFVPYSARNLPNGGIATEIVRLAFLQAGYEIEVEWVPWPRAMENARKGLYDGILGAWFTQPRVQFFNYSSPFMRNELVFFKRRGEAISFKTLKDLKPYRIGVAKEAAPHELLKGELGANLEVINSGFLSIKMLMGRRLDLIADEKLSIIHILNRQFPHWRHTIEVVDPPFQVNQLYVVISRKVADHQTIVDNFNRGFQKIRTDGSVDALRKKHGFD